MLKTLTNTNLSFHIIESISKEDKLITWSYPTLSQQQRHLITKNVFNSKDPTGFYYLRLKEWVYLKEFVVSNKRFAVCVIALDYDCNKYEVLCNILSDKYLNTRNAVELTKLYLNFCTLSSFQENGTTNDFKKVLACSACIVKDMIRAFGPEIILVYTMLLFKKRAVAYHSNLKELQKGLLGISKLMPFRDPNDFLYPKIDDIKDFQGRTFFVVGTTREPPLLNSYHYDVFINLSNNSITIAPHAKDIFAITKVQRDFALFLAELVEKTDVNDTHILAEIKSKTEELLANLNLLATVKVGDKRVVTMDCLRDKKFNPKTENFLFNLAVAENIMML